MYGKIILSDTIRPTGLFENYKPLEKRNNASDISRGSITPTTVKSLTHILESWNFYLIALKNSNVQSGIQGKHP